MDGESGPDDVVAGSQALVEVVADGMSLCTIRRARLECQSDAKQAKRPTSSNQAPPRGSATTRFTRSIRPGYMRHFYVNPRGITTRLPLSRRACQLIQVPVGHVHSVHMSPVRECWLLPGGKDVLTTATQPISDSMNALAVWLPTRIGLLSMRDRPPPFGQAWRDISNRLLDLSNAAPGIYRISPRISNHCQRQWLMA